MSKHLFWSLIWSLTLKSSQSRPKLFKLSMIWQPEVHVEEEGQDEQEEVAKSAAKIT